MPVGCFRKAGKETKGGSVGSSRTQQGTDGGVPTKTGVTAAVAGTDVVTLNRKSEDDIVGLVFSGGVDTPNKPHITNLKTGGLAARCDGLIIGDYITAINGIHTEKLACSEIVTLLKNTGALIQIQVAFELPPRAPNSAFSVKCRKTAVSLVKDDESIGMVIRGGAQTMNSKSRPLTIAYVRPGGSADRDTTLRVGDRIVAINGVTVITSTVVTARRLIKNSDTAVHMVIEYDIAVMETIQNAEGPVLVEISRYVGQDLGITLAHQYVQGKPTILIETVKSASIAERSGALHVGDHMLAINGVELNNMSAAEAKHFLIAGKSNIVQLEILPVGHLINTRRVMSTTMNLSNSSDTPSLHLDASFYSVFSEELHQMPSRQGSVMPPPRQPLSSGPPARKYKSINSLGSVTSAGAQSITCHEETLTVCLFANHVGLGIVLHSNTLPNEMMECPPVIGHLEPNSSAERCGTIQEGDRVLCINGTDTAGYSLTACKRLLEISVAKCVLEVAFDTADTGIYNSGCYQVRLFKRGSSLGIRLEERLTHSGGKSIFISAVKKGSAAYRSGAVHCDDELLSVDSINLLNVNIEDARQILQNTDEVLKLKLKKASSDQHLDDELVFTVEIPKQNNSVGLTISGKEQPNHAISISEITSGGVAERTGALHIGDRLLSINGKSLKGQPVSFAIQQLYNGGDVISLTICRDKNSGGQKTQKGVSAKPREENSGRSRDSALDSWDSQVSPVSQSPGDLRQLKARSGPGKHNWKAMSELEKFGKLELSSMRANLAPHTGQQQPSTSSPHDTGTPAPSPQIPDMPSGSKVLTVNLSRQEHENFGFGLSNALYAAQEGCYIKAVGACSPADRAGLQKYDRVIQVNDVDVQAHNCNDIVPIIESAGTTLDLLVIRNAQETGSNYSSSVQSSQQSSTDSIHYVQ